MKTYKQLLEKFEKEVEDLQDKCEHKRMTDWIDEWWTIGHSTGNQVRVCKICNKKVEKKKSEIKEEEK